MKTFIKTLGLIAALTFALVPGPVRAQAQAQDDNNVSFQTFYDQLASQGNWIQTADYGYVFQPTVSDSNWRPYTYGHWVNTDEGMMWVSDEPFGWATYHYGRWVNLDGYGWVWVPGYTWAPAWVSWRDGDDECGWAPLPPDTLADIDYYDDDYGWDFGFHIGDDCDTAFGIGPGCYNFCPVAYIGDSDCWRHFRDRRDNFALINHTRNVTNLNLSRDPSSGRFDRVHAGGPSVAALNARSRTPIQHVRLTSTSTLAANGRMNGNSLSVYAPNVDRQTAIGARPHTVAGTLVQTHVNRGTNINDPLAVNSRIRPAGATAGQIHAAALAESQTPASAKIDTAQTRISRPLTRSLILLHPNANVGGTRSTASVGTGVRPNAFTGIPRVSAPSVRSESRYTGEAVAPRTTTRTYPPSSSFHSYSPTGNYRPSPAFHPSMPTYHPQSGFQSRAPAYHPQSSFHAAPSAPHFSGGAPAARSSGGGGGGGRPSGGGGQAGGGQRGR